jgi:hypothetical protein
LSECAKTAVNSTEAPPRGQLDRPASLDSTDASDDLTEAPRASTTRARRGYWLDS